MSISSPLPSGVSLRAPLVLSLSLAPLVAPPPPTASADIFDTLDSKREPRTLEDDPVHANGCTSAGARPRQRTALGDWTRVLFPSVRLPVDGDADADGSGSPEWLGETSGAVTALVTAQTGAGLRVAVGSRDGTLYLFAPPTPTPTPTTHPEVARERVRSPIAPPFTIPPSAPSSSDRLSTTSRKLSLESLAPEPSPAPSSPTLSSPPTSPRPLSLRSRPSIGLARPPTISRQASNTSIALSHHRVPSPSETHGRPRKASATVSISTAESPFASSSVPIASPPLPALVFPPASPAPSSKRHRPRASLTTGIGLWEHESSAGPRSPDVDEEESDFSEAQVEEQELERLEPVVRVRLGGWGAVVALRVVEGTRFGRDEGGKVLLVLRRSGLLAVHSLLDGREFGTCDASPGGQSAFDGMEVLSLEDGLVAICFGGPGVGFVAVDPDTLRAQPPVECATSLIRPAAIFKQGFHFLVFASSTSSPSLLVLPVLPERSNPDSEVARPLGIVRLEPPHSAGALSLPGPVLGIRNCADDLLAFDATGIELFTIRDQRIASLGSLPLAGITGVCVEGYHAVLVSTVSSLCCYKLEPAQSSGRLIFNFVLLESQLLSSIELATVLPAGVLGASSDFLVARAAGDGQRVLESVAIARRSSDPNAEDGGPKFVRRKLYASRGGPGRGVTAVVERDRESVILGYSTGAIASVRYAELESSSPRPIHAQLAGAITVMQLYTLGDRPILIAGSADGLAGAWDLSDWQPLALFSLFASPVAHIAPVPGEGTTVAFVSANSPLALVELFPPRILFVLPGTKSAVESISSNKNEMLILYRHGLARVCDVDGLELRRSMDRRTALGVLAEGGWTTWFSLASLRPLSEPAPSAQDPFLKVDLRTAIEDALRLLPWAETRSANDKTSCDLVSDTQNSRDQLGLVRLLLSQVSSWGLDRDTDELVEGQLGIRRPEVVFPAAIQSLGAVSVPVCEGQWTLSPTATAQRLLHVVCLLRVFLNFPDTERYASQVIVFYASFLADAVGPSFEFPALEVLADYWLDGSAEVQQAARLLFGSYLGAASDTRVLALVERWQDLLPSCQPPGSNHHASTDQAVLILGLVASEKFKLLPAPLLTDISESITACLADSLVPYHQALATELCTRGFEIWQNYVDAMPLVRRLFGLATGRTASTPNDLRNLARLATLHVAGVNTPLFMTTLSFDILNAKSPSHRNATMKLLGFMVRKKPLVLHTSLPRLAEAVVKSLDPTVTSLRESVQQAATVILNELVRTYPSIDFHGPSQRLAVGTHEGAAIVYDLKTATRLYVLEGHKRAITALSWSPDGRRLVSVSLEESRVVVWKVGVGILSMFTPGAPPRQGSGGTATPFKTLDFAVGDEAHMTTAATLEWVAFEWPAERTTRLKIRESALTFAV